MPTDAESSGGVRGSGSPGEGSGGRAATRRLRGVRRLYRDRGSGASRTDTAYAVYLAVLSLAIVAVPVVRAVAIALAAPESLAALLDEDTLRVVAAAAGALLGALAAAGSVFGPVQPSPFFVMLLAGTSLRRQHSLRRSFTSAAAAVTLTLTTIAVLVGGVLWATGSAPIGRALLPVAAATCFGLLASVVWLAGQRIGTRRAWVLPSAIGVLTLVSVAVPGAVVAAPWGWLALTLPTAAPTATSGWPLLALAVAAATAVAVVTRLLEQLRGNDLLDQAHRWDTAAVAAGSGDVASAFAMFRPSPRLGRSWKAIAWAAPVPRFLWRDLIGAARTPVRLVTGSASLACGALLIAMGYAAGSNSAIVLWGASVAGTVIAYLAIGVLCDGLRHAAEAVAAAPVYRYSPARLYLLHATFPLVWTLLWSSGGGIAGTVAGVATGLIPEAPAGAVACAVAVCVFLVAVRAYDGARGPLPLALLTPVPTPAGDLSGLIVLGWQADAALIAAAVGSIATVLLATGSGAAGACVLIVATSAVAALTARRLSTT